MLSRERTPLPVALPTPAPLPSLSIAFSRRAALFGAVTLAAAPAAALSALASTVGKSDSDAQPSPLAATLQAEFKQLAHEESIATEKFDAADELLEYPDPPEEVFCRDGDMAALRWHVWDVDWRSKRRWWGEDARIARLRADDFSRSNSEINRRATARRNEIVNAWDGWQAEMQAVQDRCGYTAARVEWLAATNRYEAFRLRLIHLQTTDSDIMAIKAAVVTERYSDEDVSYLGRAIEQHLEQQDDLEALCFSIVRDFALRSHSEVAGV